MPRVIVLDTFPLSSAAKREPDLGVTPTRLDVCQQWIKDCIAGGNSIVAPAISYYETLRELERLGAVSQIARLRAFCHAVPFRYISLADAHLDLASQLWGRARNAGTPTSGVEALDGDVILAAQALSLGLSSTGYIVATTNVKHLSRFVPCDEWTNIVP